MVVMPDPQLCCTVCACVLSCIWESMWPSDFLFADAGRCVFVIVCVGLSVSGGVHACMSLCSM